MHPVHPFNPLTVDDVATVLGVSVRTVENHIEEQGLPRPVKIGKIRYWHPEVFYGWLDRVLRGEARAEPSAQPAPAQVVKEADPREERAARDLPVARKPAGETPRLSAVERARMRDEAALRKFNG
jgi:predicted DNA-binding transcriptional regulator AlpA